MTSLDNEEVKYPMSASWPIDLGARTLALLSAIRFGPVIFLVSALLGGCEKVPAQTHKPEPPRQVRVQTIQLTSQEIAVSYSGTVQPRVLADLGFRIGGKVIDRPVNIGDQVVTGQVLARLDPADLRRTLEAGEQLVAAAAADARNTRADFDRYDRLGRLSPAFLPSEYDKRHAAMEMAKARLAQAERQLELARNQLDYATLQADADGVITALPVEVGQVVTAGQIVASLAHSAETDVVVDVPENRLPDIRTASLVSVTLWSAPDRILKGRLREIGARADPTSRTFAVKISVLDPPKGILSLGMTASVRFVRPAETPVVLVPSTALTDQDGAPAVWVLDTAHQRAALRRVQVAAYTGDGMVTITAGLVPGDQVVTAGTGLISSDMAVTAWSGPVR
jgi:membrane fusion protein, multidrug efflux system